MVAVPVISQKIHESTISMAMASIAILTNCSLSVFRGGFPIEVGDFSHFCQGNMPTFGSFGRQMGLKNVEITR